jgi:chemotaxis protein methyltransferase CheR
LRSRLIELKINTIAEYLDLLNHDKEEMNQFIDAVTTHETYFHRTPKVWEYFFQNFLPNWFSLKNRSILNIWSAACSTGEEPYTISMYCEEFAKKNPAFQYRIFASDISQGVINIAKKGCYKGRSLEMLEKLNPQLIVNYMDNDLNESKKIKSFLKSKITFSQQNLLKLKNIPNSFDIIFLRNVLIYFDAKDQEKVIANITHHLENDGKLIIGESETLTNLTTELSYIQPLIYSRRKKA